MSFELLTSDYERGILSFVLYDHFIMSPLAGSRFNLFIEHILIQQKLS